MRPWEGTPWLRLLRWCLVPEPQAAWHTGIQESGTPYRAQLSCATRHAPLHPHTHYPLRRRTKAGVHIRSHPSLRHSEKGAVSLARSGADFLWAFNRALHLDETHAVVGRVTEASLPLLDRLNGSATQPDDSPTSRVAVARCGLTDAAGSVELAGPGPEGAPADETPEAARTRLAREAEAARLGLRQARKGGVWKGEEGGDCPCGEESGGVAGRWCFVRGSSGNVVWRWDRLSCTPPRGI